MTTRATGSTSARSRTRSRGGICFEVSRSGEERKRVRIANDVDPSFRDSVETSEPDGREFADALPELSLPGSGDRLETCGDKGPTSFCPDCGEPYEYGLTCRRSRCPRCWQSWAFDRARALAAKVESLRAERARPGESPRFHHLTVSFANLDVRFDSDDALDRAFNATKALLPQPGVHTGYLLYHPWRIAEEYRGEVNGHDSGSGDMTWNDVFEKVESEEWSWEAVREEFLIYAPHFHVIALSDFVQCGAITEQIEEETGVVIHRITKQNSNVSMYGVEDLAKVAAYSLSHVGLEEDDDTHRAQYRAFGEVANHSASGAAEAKVDAALRKVSNDVLGVDFSTGTCSEFVLPEESDVVGSDPASSSASPAVADGGKVPDNDWSLSGTLGSTGRADDLWDHHPVAAPESAEAPSVGRCGGTLRPMFAVDEYLECDNWRESIADDTLDRLLDAREEWKSLAKPAGEDVPPPGEDGPPPD